MLCDLHIHSWHSSGSQTVEEICREAVSKNIELISLTEDDTTAPCKEVTRLAPQYGLNYILGVEVSATFEGRLFRFLAYDFDPENRKFQELLTYNQSVWNDVSINVIKAYSKYIPEVSVEDYLNFTPAPGLGGFNHNKYMNSIGRDGSFNADMKFFKEHPNETAEIRKYYQFKDVIDVVPVLHQAGAKVFVSGEYFKDRATFNNMADKVIALGADGLECYRNLAPDLEKAMVSYAEEHDLLISGGGNGHGSWTNASKYSIGISNVHFNDLNLGTIQIKPGK